MKKYVLYNPIAGSGMSESAASSLTSVYPECEIIKMDITEIKNYGNFLSLAKNEDIILCGGDGTLNRFINAIKNIEFDNDVLYLPTGNGNDFANDVGQANATKPFSIKKYITDLPTVTVNGREYSFINGIGYGIDGYCCEVGDKLRAEGKKPNYTAIAIKGLLFHYKPTSATVIVDGVEKRYKKVWIAPAMHGRYYGGGMIPTPDQDRNNADKKLSLMVFHGSGKLRTLMIFPSIFKGEHVKQTKYVEVITGKNITVKFDSPRALQIDGETILDVTEYSVAVAKKPVSIS